ncbi:MAG: YezD family protein [candidate division NC10 bacterium]|nr:YezD family protein [candidate division NC10 bacterium]
MNAQVVALRDDPLAEDGVIIRQIVQAIKSVRHGQVRIIIQDSRVVQIDKTEKLRLA